MSVRLNRILILLFLCLQQIIVLAQNERFPLTIIYNSIDTTKYIRNLKTEFKLSSQKSRTDKITEIIFNLYENGYIAARLDSAKSDSSLTTAFIYTGLRYNLMLLQNGNVDDDILNHIGFGKKKFKAKLFNYEEIKNLLEKVLTYCERTGYPFATIKLDSIQIDNDEISASLFLTKNNKITIDSIILKGDATISYSYLQNYLGIKQNDLYNEEIIGRIQKKLSSLPFLIETKPPLIGFTPDKARIVLYYNKKKASQFDGYLGVLPNNETSGKLLLTGDVKLKLLNSFGHGEFIEMNWKSQEQKTQHLLVHFNYPYLLNSPFGLDYSLTLYKKDTSYITVNQNFGVQYFFNGNNYLKVYVVNNKSSLLSVVGLENLTVLPPYADVS